MKISNQDVVFAMDKDNQARTSIKDGETVIVQTLDCFSNTIKSESDLISEVDMSKVNPATGPIYVEESHPGDTLRITIRKIDLAPEGVIVAMPNFGLLGHKIEKESTAICQLKDDYVDFYGHQVPYRKMIGVIGTAPAKDPVNTGTPGYHGGNMDTIAITEGSVLFLPVQVPGALLALGDCHAAMGDGEIIGAGLEIPAEVTITVDVLRDFQLPLPLVETKDAWMTIASADTMEEAGRLATENMAEVIQRISDLDINQAAMLLSLAGDLRVSQVVNPQVTMRMVLPKSCL